MERWQSRSDVAIINQTGEASRTHMWSGPTSDGALVGTMPSDSTNRIVDLTFAQASNLAQMLAVVPTVGAYTITLTAGHGYAPGEDMSIVDMTPGSMRFFSGRVLSVNTNVLVLDSPVSYAFDPASSITYRRSSALNVNGASTAQIFSMSNPYPEPVDVTGIRLHIFDDAEMLESTFGGINALTRGVLLRKRVDPGLTDFENIWNIKTNSDIALRATRRWFLEIPPEGYTGMIADFTFAGRDNHGAVMRVGQDQALDIVIQDDLRGIYQMGGVARGRFAVERREA